MITVKNLISFWVHSLYTSSALPNLNTTHALGSIQPHLQKDTENKTKTLFENIPFFFKFCNVSLEVFLIEKP